MAVIRVAKNENYTVMANHHLRNKNLSLKAVGLMSKLLSLPPEWDYSVAGLAAICKEGMTAIRAALKELEENGYLVRERKNSEKGYFVYEYTLYEIPKTPHAENTYTVNTHTDVAHTVNRTQLNTNKLNTNKLSTNKLNKEKKKEKNISISSFDKILNDIEDNELRQLYYDYIDMRETIKSPVSERALAMLIDRCARISNFNIELQKEMLEAAVINNWKSVHLPERQTKEKRNGGGSNEPGGRIYNREKRYSDTGYDALKNFNLE